MKNLGKYIERIKQMMKTINEGSFDEPTESEVPLDVRQESTKIIPTYENIQPWWLGRLMRYHNLQRQ